MYDVRFLIDTNVFVRFFVRDSEKNFEECRELLKAIGSGEIVASTSSTVIAEICWLLKSYYKIPKNDIVNFVENLLSLQHLSIDNSDNPQLANALYRKTSVKFIDALLASLPSVQDGTMTVVSYDKDFDKLGVKRIEPRELLQTFKT